MTRGRRYVATRCGVWMGSRSDCHPCYSALNPPQSHSYHLWRWRKGSCSRPYGHAEGHSYRLHDVYSSHYTAVYNVRSGVSTPAGRGDGRALYTLVSINTQRMYIVSQSSAQVHGSCGSPSLTTDSTHHIT